MTRQPPLIPLLIALLLGLTAAETVTAQLPSGAHVTTAAWVTTCAPASASPHAPTRALVKAHASTSVLFPLSAPSQAPEVSDPNRTQVPIPQRARIPGGACVAAGAVGAAKRLQPSAEVPQFSWPMAVPRPIVRAFEAPSSPYGPGHRGVDLAGAPGKPVMAAADGVVAFAGVLAGRGVVSIDHPGGLRTTYEPLEVQVVAGQQVTRGTVIGLLMPGHAECSGVCLHWGVRRGAEYFDPIGLLSAGRVRLLPWDGP